MGPLILLVFAGESLACSGIEAAATMQRAVLIGRTAIAVSLGLTALVWRKAVLSKVPVLWVAAVVSLLMCGLHPGLWLSPYNGDCGELRVLGSFLMLVLHGGLALLALPFRPNL